MLTKLAGLYAEAATVAFGWAETRRRGAPPVDGRARTEAEAKEWLDEYLGGHATTERLANMPGSPLHLIGLAFRDMSLDAEQWDAWGHRLLAAHDRLVA